MYDQEMKMEFVDHIVEFFEVLYQPRLTEEDLRELTAFYLLPVGQKLTRMLPEVQMKSRQIGQQIGIRISGRMVERLQEDGLIEL